MKAKYLLAVIVLITFSSCKHGVNIKFENKTNYIIDSVIIESNFNLIKFEQVEINKSHNTFIDFKKNKLKGDGIFTLRIFKDTVNEFHQFGYYSNGIPPSNDIDIIIKNDTIIFNRQN